MISREALTLKVWTLSLFLVISAYRFLNMLGKTFANSYTAKQH